ncbi:hypothetical protein V6N13_059576 [Hibiscus sabdariffa]|uniref:Uncharacterized protein n=1 Tax=Hibiscus sabdariffa TaxID=183260 RepID=A0ABR2GCN5_9ROSI
MDLQRFVTRVEAMEREMVVLRQKMVEASKSNDALEEARRLANESKEEVVEANARAESSIMEEIIKKSLSWSCSSCRRAQLLAEFQLQSGSSLLLLILLPLTKCILKIRKALHKKPPLGLTEDDNF